MKLRVGFSKHTFFNNLLVRRVHLRLVLVQFIGYQFLAYKLDGMNPDVKTEIKTTSTAGQPPKLLD